VHGIEDCGAALSYPSPNQLRVDLPAGLPAGTLVINDTYWPGWKAWADGRPVAIVPAFNTFRAVAIPAGCRQVRMEYQPPLFYLGLVLSLLAAALLAWAVAMGMKGAVSRSPD
jgi:uncharacterized membrane protein YfhO